MPKPQEKPSLLTRIVQSKPPLYWWGLLNISMICVAVMSWIFFLPTFNYPEDPKNYERLIWLKRAPELPAFEAINAPEGSTIDTSLAHTIFTSSELADSDLAELNQTLLRNYIQGIKLEKLNYYLKGTFRVLETRELNTQDLFDEGIIIKAQALRKLDHTNELAPFLVEIEYILPGVNKLAMQEFPIGENFELHLVPNYCNILHIERRTGEDGETVIYLSVVPLTTSPPQLAPNGLNITITVPERIYPQHALPILK